MQSEQSHRPENQPNAPAPHQRMAGLSRGEGQGSRGRSGESRHYSRFVQSMRVLLPIAALVVIMLLIIWPQFENPYVATAAIDPQKQADLTKDVQTNRLLTARYEDIDSNGQPYVIEADEAVQQRDNPDVIDLTYPKALITLDAESTLKVRANEGEFAQTSQNLFLNGETSFTRSDGTVLRTESIRGQLQEGTAQTSDPVYIEGPSGTLDAQGMRVENQGMLVIFKGPAMMQIYTEDRIVPDSQTMPQTSVNPQMKTKDGQ